MREADGRKREGGQPRLVEYASSEVSYSLRCVSAIGGFRMCVASSLWRALFPDVFGVCVKMVEHLLIGRVSWWSAIIVISCFTMHLNAAICAVFALNKKFRM